MNFNGKIANVKMVTLSDCSFAKDFSYLKKLYSFTWHNIHNDMELVIYYSKFA